jgi:hypothetical protein
MVGAQTDPGVGTDAPVDDDDDDDDDGNASDSGPLLPVTPAVDTNPANAGNSGSTGLPPAAPIDGPVSGGAGTNAGTGVGGTAAGLPQTGSGGYLEAGSANSTFYMMVSVVAMMGLAGSLVYARVRAK